jgi:hypothetical protein
MHEVKTNQHIRASEKALAVNDCLLSCEQNTAIRIQWTSRQLLPFMEQQPLIVL